MCWTRATNVGLFTVCICRRTEAWNIVHYSFYHYHDSNFPRTFSWLEQVVTGKTYTDEWRHLKRGFIELSTRQRKYIPLVVNHTEISGTVEGDREEEAERKTVSSLGHQLFWKDINENIHVSLAVLYSLSLPVSLNSGVTYQVHRPASLLIHEGS